MIKPEWAWMNTLNKNKMNIHEKRVDNLSATCWDIFNNYGGYDYNDEMLYQLQGLQDSIHECMNEEDWENMVEEAETTYTWFKHIKKIRVLQENIPTSLYC